MNDDLIEKILHFNKDREPGPLQLKYQAMAESPFRFFRGTCGLFYSALAGNYPFPGSPSVWACGDLHIENFGSYKGTSRLVYFDMNDFDEALLAPALWELCRLTVSIQLAAEEIGFSKKEKDDLLDILIYYYRQVLKKGKPIVIEKETARGLIKKLVNKVEERSVTELLRKRTDKDNPDKLLFNDRLFVLPKPEKRSLINDFNQWLVDKSYQGYSVADAGFRIAGTGSIGVKRYLLLIKHVRSDKKRWLVDVKEAQPSATAAYTSLSQPKWINEAARVIAVQEMMQHISPAFLSSFQHQENWFVVKELQPTTDKVNLSQAIKQPAQVENYIASLGTLTASGQLRSSGRKTAATADELEDFAHDDSWNDVLKQWTIACAAQTKQQYAVYKNAWMKGAFRK